jgi:hypothetical protein
MGKSVIKNIEWKSGEWKTPCKFWVYMGLSLLVIGTRAFFTVRDFEVDRETVTSFKPDLYLILTHLLIGVLAFSIAWWIARKYTLNYFVVCILGAAIYVLGGFSIASLWRADYRELSSLLGAVPLLIPLFILVILILTAAIYLISSPIQSLVFKFEKNRTYKKDGTQNSNSV